MCSSMGRMKRASIAVFLLLGACAREQPRSTVSGPPEVEATAAVITAFTEGPAADAEGNVFFTETINQRIMKMAPDGTLTVFREHSNNANGLLFDDQFRLLACEGAPSKGALYQDSRPRVTRTVMRTGKVEVLASDYNGQPFVSPNDITMDGKGRLYFTDLPGGAVYRIDTDGKLSRILYKPEIQRPNGIEISPDDKTLYLVEANQAEGGARMIRAYDLLPDGAVANMRVFHDFYPGRSADGMCIDTRGNLYAAAGLHQRRGTSETLKTRCGVHVFAPNGDLIRFIAIPEDTITNCAFGGPDMKTLYVTAGKGLYQTQVEIPGTRR